MDYQAITDRTSHQYHLKATAQRIDQDGVFTLEGRKIVAMGFKGLQVGDYGVVTLSSGTNIDILVGDIKHQGCNSADGSQLEFIVDTNNLNSRIRLEGDFNSIYQGVITKIVIRGNVYEG